MPMRARRRLCLTLVAAAVAASASPAAANTVMIGAPGGGSTGASAVNAGSNPITVANTSLGEPGAHVTSPVTGTIVRWRINTLGIGAYTLHVVRPSSNGTYTEEGATGGDAVTSGPNTFAANLPILAGDLIAVDISGGQGVVGQSGPPGSSWVAFGPGLTPGATAFPSGPNNGAELLFNADVDFTPVSSAPAGVVPAGGCRARKAKKNRGRSASTAKAKRKCRRKR
jgi:hypothetical protein